MEINEDVLYRISLDRYPPSINYNVGVPPPHPLPCSGKLREFEY